MYILSNGNGIDSLKVLTFRRNPTNWTAKLVDGSFMDVTDEEYAWLMTFNGNFIEVDEELGINLIHISGLFGNWITMEDGEEIELTNTLMNSLKYNMASVYLSDEIDFMENLDPPYSPYNYRKL